MSRCSISVADACRVLFRDINCLTGEQIALEWLTIERMLLFSAPKNDSTGSFFCDRAAVNVNTAPCLPQKKKKKSPQSLNVDVSNR